MSALLLSANEPVQVWAVQNAPALDSSLGYFILLLVNIAIDFYLI